VRNRAFRREHPGLAIPPARLLYRTTASVDLRVHFESGASSAAFIAGLIARHLGDRSGLRVLEWGCGSGRCIRHLPGRLPGARLTGADVDARAIGWCRSALPSIAFVENGPFPPLPFPAGVFDAVYAISVFTHLSELAGIAWMAELGRVLAPGGIVIFTTRGDTFTGFLSDAERAAYQAYGFAVTTDDDREGHKHHLAHHAEAYVRGRLASGLEVIELEPAEPGSGLQDVWVLRKPEVGGLPSAGSQAARGAPSAEHARLIPDRSEDAR